MDLVSVGGAGDMGQQRGPAQQGEMFEEEEDDDEESEESDEDEEDENNDQIEGTLCPSHILSDTRCHLVLV